MRTLATLGLAAHLALAALPAAAQSPTNMAALSGLFPIATLPSTPEGRAALNANLATTTAIQTGTRKQPLLLPCAEQPQLALRDAFITDGNATELADGLGTTLAAAYQARARYEDFKTFGSLSKAVAEVIGYANETTKSDSNAGKFFFANGTTDGKAPVSEAAKALYAARGGVTDVFGRAYGRPAGSAGADPFGNSRPFQTAPTLVAYRGTDYFGRLSHSLDWLRGPNQNLVDSPAYPSGHTTYGYTESLMLALLVPERYQQMVARAAEYGDNRIVLGAHYVMDVLGGRTTSLHAVAHLLANDPAYVGVPRKNPAVIDAAGRTVSADIVLADFPAALRAARADVKAALEAACGAPLAACAERDEGRFRDARANEAATAMTQTYDLPVVHKATADAREDVGTVAPEAGHLLTAAFPALTLAEANEILTETQGPGGGFLDDGSKFGVYSRLNLYAAAGRAAAKAAAKAPSTATR